MTHDDDAALVARIEAHIEHVPNDIALEFRTGEIRALLALAKDGLRYRWRFSREWALANGWEVVPVDSKRRVMTHPKYPAELRSMPPAAYMIHEPDDYNYNVFGIPYETEDEAWERIEAAVERKYDDERERRLASPDTARIEDGDHGE